jgi:hypothetical protein
LNNPLVFYIKKVRSKGPPRAKKNLNGNAGPRSLAVLLPHLQGRTGPNLGRNQGPFLEELPDPDALEAEGRFRFVERNRDKIREIDSYISSFYREHRAKIPLVALLYSVTFLFWAVEIHMTLLFLHVPGLTFVKSLFVITLGNIALLVPTVPASLGVYEITNIGVFALLGWGAAIALSMAIIRRVIMLLWTGIGLLIMAKHQIKP